jgi:lysophospholipase L1-like esterase
LINQIFKTYVYAIKNPGMMLSVLLPTYTIFVFTGFMNINVTGLINNPRNAESPPNHRVIQVDTLKTYLALGDSYTIGQSVRGSETYPAQTIALLEKQGANFHSPEIIATTGWTTADLQNAMDHHRFGFQTYDIVTLLIGVNNQYQQKSQSDYVVQFRELLQKAISLAGNQSGHVIVLSIPDYSVTPFAQSADTALISREIAAFNSINKEISRQYKVCYLDITNESRKAAADTSLLADDHLHYSGKEYAVWAAMLAQTIKNHIK